MRTTKVWLTVWQQWCVARNIDDKMDSYSPQVLDEIPTKFYAEVISGRNTGQRTSQTRLTRQVSSLKKLPGVHHQQARVQEVSRDSKLQGEMSQILRQRKTAQQSSGIHS